MHAAKLFRFVVMGPVGAQPPSERTKSYRGLVSDGFYQDQIVALLINLTMRRRDLAAYRSRVVPAAHGRVLGTRRSGDHASAQPHYI
jgi:hypothetical protein